MKKSESEIKKEKTILVITENPFNELNKSIEKKMHIIAENKKTNFISITSNNFYKTFSILNIDKIEGIIIIFDQNNLLENSENFNKLYKNISHIPVITINTEIEGLPGIIIDYKNGIKKIISHVINEHNLQNTAFIYDSVKNNLFYKIFIDLLEEMNIEYNPELLISYDSNLNSAQNILKKIIEKKIKLDLILCDNTEYLISFLNKITDTEITSNISFGGISFSENNLSQQVKPITRLTYPLIEIAEYALSALVSIINGEKKRNTIIFPPGIEIGEECSFSIKNNKLNHKQNSNSIDKKSNIFIVDDNQEIRTTLYSSLQKNYNVFLAENGDEAVKKLKNIPLPDIIISDIMMDKMDGYELFQKLSSNNRYKHIPFIFISVKGTADERVKGLKKGAVDYITKPFLIDEITAKIESIIKHHKIQEKNNLNKIHDKISNFLIDIKDNTNEEKKTEIFSMICRQHNLTKREQEILNLLLQGLLNKEISFILKIKKRTVDFHVQNIYTKFKVSSRIQLMNVFNSDK